MEDVADNEAVPAQQQEPLAHITNALLHGVSPNDYTSRVEDSLAVLGQALRANGAGLRGNGARTVGVQVTVLPVKYAGISTAALMEVLK